MTKQTYIVVREFPYWVTDESLPKARTRFKRLTGKYPSNKATITAFTGELEDLDNIQVNDMGDILYSKNLIKADLQN